MKLISLLLFAIAVLAQVSDNPPYIPRWQGPAPVRVYIDPTMEPYRPEIMAALWVWQRETVQSIMAETRDAAADRTIAIRMIPEGGWMNVLAVALYPAPMFREPEAGDVWISRAVVWSEPNHRRFLLALLVHEFGHSLGMGHYYESESVMFPNIDPAKTALSPLDRRMFRCLYGTECGQ